MSIKIPVTPTGIEPARAVPQPTAPPCIGIRLQNLWM